jgi:hypothetical protein
MGDVITYTGNVILGFLSLTIDPKICSNIFEIFNTITRKMTFFCMNNQCKWT